MKTSKFTEEQVVGLLRKAEKGDKSVEALCREFGVTVQTFYRWKKKYGGIEVPELRKLRTIERENATLKRLLAERDLDVAALKDALGKR